MDAIELEDQFRQDMNRLLETQTELTEQLDRAEVAGVYIVECSVCVPDLRKVARERRWAIERGHASQSPNYSICHRDQVPVKALLTKNQRSHHYVIDDVYGWAYPLWVVLAEEADRLFYVGASDALANRILNHSADRTNPKLLSVADAEYVEDISLCYNRSSSLTHVEEYLGREYTSVGITDGCIDFDNVEMFAYWW